MSTKEYSACVKGKLKCADSQLAKVFKEEKAAKKAAKAAKKAKKEQKKLQEKIDKANEKKNYKKLGKLQDHLEAEATEWIESYIKDPHGVNDSVELTKEQISEIDKELQKLPELDAPLDRSLD